MNPATMINLPDASTTLASAATFSVPIFTTFIILGAVLIGIVFGGVFVARVTRTTLSAAKTAIGARRGGRGRRRR